MQRYLLEDLKVWLTIKTRKPAILRGARQVGKTWLVRELAKQTNYKLVELNFERNPEFALHFSSNNPYKILNNLESALNLEINKTKTIIFLDEIQAASEILAKLRWFYEEMPEIAIIAAGSLLEFVLNEHSFSMPVGRIQYFFVEPFSFEEFLMAKNEIHLLKSIKNILIDEPFNEALHNKANELFKEYIIIGGMPEVISIWVNSSSLTEVSTAHTNLINTYQDDFNKYTKKISASYLPEVLKFVPRALGQKFMYSRINSAARNENIRDALNLLVQARICNIVQSCYANGIPLGAEINSKTFKVLLLDTGLVANILGLRLHQFNNINDIFMINNGAIAEQVVGQLLRQIHPRYINPELFYWNREVPGSSAEIDYLIQENLDIIPIEVKSGSDGKLRSLHQFMHDKNKKFAVRVYAGNCILQDVSINVSGIDIEYQLLSIPFYLIQQLPRLIREVLPSKIEAKYGKI